MTPDLLWEFSSPVVFLWSNWMSFSQTVPACTGDSNDQNALEKTRGLQLPVLANLGCEP